MLRAAKLLKEANYDTDRETLLETIKKLNDQCEKKLMTFAECRTMRAITPFEYEKYGIGKAWYCEDERLSIGHGGEYYKALYLPPETPSIEPKRLDWLLEIMAMYFDWSAVRPKKNGEMMRAWRKIDDAIHLRRSQEPKGRWLPTPQR